MEVERTHEGVQGKEMIEDDVRCDRTLLAQEHPQTWTTTILHGWKVYVVSHFIPINRSSLQHQFSQAND
jgi:hypothetical protein